MLKTKYLMLFFLIIIYNCAGFRKTANISDTAGLYKVIFHRGVQNNEDCYVELFENDKKILFKETEKFTCINIWKQHKKIVLLSNLNRPNTTHLLVIAFNGNHIIKRSLTAEILQNYTEYGITVDSNFIRWYNEKKPEIKINEINDTFRVSIKTPNNKFIAFYETKDTTKRKGIAGIGYGKNFKGQNVDSMVNKFFNSDDNITYTGDLKAGSLKGVRSKQSIMKRIMKILAAIRYDYNKRLREIPGLKGKIVLKFRIIPTGDVISCKIVEATLFDEQFQKKVQDHILKCKFECIDTLRDTTEVVYPFIFSQ
jgi:hypothetical protein